MKVLFHIFLALVLSLSSVGCVSASQKRERAIATAVWVAKQSIEVGKINTAKNAIDEVARMVPKPKNLPIIKEAKTDNGETSLVILPTNLQNKKIIIENSQEYKNLIIENSKLASQLRDDNKYIGELSRHVDDALRAQEAELNREKRKGFLSLIVASISGLGLIGTILLVIFAPSALPIIIGLFKGLLNWVVNLFKNWIKSFKNG